MSRFELPNGIKHEDKLYNVVYLEEMTGKQQDYLVNTKYKSAIEHIEKVLVDLIEKVESTEGDKLTVSKHIIVKDLLNVDDIQFLLIKLREITFDETYIMSEECPHCKTKNDMKLDLSALEVLEGKQEPEKALVLPKSGEEIEYKDLNYKALKMHSQDVESFMNSATTSTILMMLERIGEDGDITADKIKSLKAKDTSFIIENAPVRNKIDTEVITECRNCGEEFSTELEVLSPGFLLPSKT